MKKLLLLLLLLPLFSFSQDKQTSDLLKLFTLEKEYKELYPTLDDMRLEYEMNGEQDNLLSPEEEEKEQEIYQKFPHDCTSLAISGGTYTEKRYNLCTKYIETYMPELKKDSYIYKLFEIYKRGLSIVKEYRNILTADDNVFDFLKKNYNTSLYYYTDWGL